MIQKFADRPLKKCPKCGKPVEKLASAPAFQFKGTGWYVTDYANKGKGKSGDEGKSDSKSEAKAESKSESKSEGGKSDAGKSKDAAKDSKPTKKSA